MAGSRGQRCSWVDMASIRQALANGERGDQKALQRMRCVAQPTVSGWKLRVKVMEALERARPNIDYSMFEEFQPSHCEALGAAFNKRRKEWTPEDDNAVAEWVGRCEAEEWTVKELKEELAAHFAGLNPPAEGKPDPDWQPDVHCMSMQDLLAERRDLDAIITDPPYPREFLPLYGELARLAKDALKPEGILAVMCGQSYLPELLALMTEHMPYRWTLAYLTPGGQAVQLWDRKVNTFWKPVLLFGGVGHWMGDVVRSNVNDNDKRFHHWGQSESGMLDLVLKLTRPAQLVCDPFLGAGTTGVVCIATNRTFIGCDTDPAKVEKAKTRIQRARQGQQNAGVNDNPV